MGRKLIGVLFLLSMPFAVMASNIPFDQNPWANFTTSDGWHFLYCTGTFNWTSNSYLTFNSNYGGTITITMDEGSTTFTMNSISLKGASWSITITIQGYSGSTFVHSQDLTVNNSAWQTYSVSGFAGINKVIIVNPSNYTDVGVDNLNFTVPNTAPTDISLSNSSISDGSSSGTTVGTFSSTDAHDSGGHTYSFASGGTDNSSFTISGTSLLTAFVANYATKSSYAIKIRSTDTGGLYYEKNFTVTVNEPIGPTPDYLQVSGVSDPAAANGIYEKQSGTYGSLGYEYWKHQGAAYYLYADEYSGSDYWNLDNDLNDDDIYIYASMSGGPYISPDLVPSGNWSDWSGSRGSGFAIVPYEPSLPVGLVSFSARCKGFSIVLDWSTESETDNLGFILERCDDNIWTQIASYQTHNELKGQGNTSSQTEYFFEDKIVESGKEYAYRLSDVSTKGEITVYASLSIKMDGLPVTTEMKNACPNPFNPRTYIAYQLAGDSDVSIIVFDMLGRQINSLFNGHQSAGSYHVYWNAKDESGCKVPSGGYIIQMKTEKTRQIQKVLLLK